MSKEKQGKRFVQIFAEDCGFFGPESSLVVDTETGVTYLIIRNTFGFLFAFTLPLRSMCCHIII